MSSCTWNSTPEPIFGNYYIRYFIFIKDSVEVKNKSVLWFSINYLSTLEENAFMFSMFTSALAYSHAVYCASLKDLSGSARADWVYFWEKLIPLVEKELSVNHVLVFPLLRHSIVCCGWWSLYCLNPQVHEHRKDTLVVFPENKYQFPSPEQFSVWQLFSVHLNFSCSFN